MKTQVIYISSYAFQARPLKLQRLYLDRLMDGKPSSHLRFGAQVVHRCLYRGLPSESVLSACPFLLARLLLESA
jgi:hypothetical protein